MVPAPNCSYLLIQTLGGSSDGSRTLGGIGTASSSWSQTPDLVPGTASIWGANQQRGVLYVHVSSNKKQTIGQDYGRVSWAHTCNPHRCACSVPAALPLIQPPANVPGSAGADSLGTEFPASVGPHVATVAMWGMNQQSKQAVTVFQINKS